MIPERILRILRCCDPLSMVSSQVDRSQIPDLRSHSRSSSQFLLGFYLRSEIWNLGSS